MESAEKAEELESGIQNHRAVPRHGVDEEALLLLLSHGSTFPCRIVDISQGGCRIRTKEQFPAGSMVRVEVNFKVRGIAFRFSGMTQWTDGRQLVGVRFMDVPLRRREELVEALFEVAAENAAKAAQQAERKETRQTPVQIPALAIVARAHPLPETVPALPGDARLRPAESNKAEAQPASMSPAQPTGRDRRETLREAVDTTATIILIKIASRLQGRILDLSLSGCRIRTDERFPVGIYTRVETEFRIAGLPFRLAGVVQAVHDRQTVGIRFLDMSSRKREQVEELIRDIREGKERDTGVRDS
jgi:c-di-GMP-binding flagellar brake protein YcgR